MSRRFALGVLGFKRLKRTANHLYNPRAIYRPKIREWLPFQYVFTNSYKEMFKFCSRILKIIIVKCGEIWFLWRNMVLWAQLEYTYKVVLTENHIHKFIRRFIRQIINYKKEHHYIKTNWQIDMLRHQHIDIQPVRKVPPSLKADLL